MSTNRSKQIDGEIEKLNEQITRLINEKAHLDALTTDKQIAIDLHKAFCHHNHTDMCGWMYEIKDGVHQWLNGNEHDRWLTKAKTLVTWAYNNKIDPFAVCEMVIGVYRS